MKIKFKTASLAYSYLRFSRPEQAAGDSLRRQRAKLDDWLARNPHTKLDDGLTYQDKGTSGFTGKHRENPDRNALALFLQHVENGRVAKGSYLVVESLDRRRDRGAVAGLLHLAPQVAGLGPGRGQPPGGRLGGRGLEPASVLSRKSVRKPS
jgi:hypothetical protein